MNKKSLLGLFMIAAVMLTGCHTINYTSSGQTVESKKRVVYFLGLAPLNGNNIQSGPSYTEKFDFVDYLITGVTLGLIQTRSVQRN